MPDNDPVRRARGLTSSVASGPVAELTGLISELFLLQGRLTSIFAGIRDIADLSGVEALTLSAVISADRPVTVPQIGRSLGHARQVIQRAARVLEGRGLITTRDNPGHKRAAFLVATDAGLEVKRRFDRTAHDVMAILAQDLDRATVRTTQEGLLTLRRVVEARDRVLRDQAGAPAR
jgi:DNA-binding MarR family transcriptional regulator